MPLIRSVDEWSREVAGAAPVALPRHVLMADPAAFTVKEAINDFMKDADGNLLKVDEELARQQWLNLFQAFQRRAGLNCVALPAQDGLEDLCFTANPSMAIPLPGGGLDIWLGIMAFGSRAGESSQHERYFRQLGLEPKSMPASVTRFEAHGDGILHPGRFILHAGIGQRSSEEAWQHLSEAYPEMDVLLYELQDTPFYHLDTALAALDETTALYMPQAFNETGLELVHKAFPNAIALNEAEGMNFAGNAFCPDKQHVFLQAGSTELEEKIAARGFTPVPIDTSEFMKSGGSVFCLKMAY
ncbi:MAG: amidinotransferase [Planctomycetes bacterium]|nr:amidinotransferase [Planctomycetota bacterium]MCP4770110.1 amidinotransferase [Planctomycetota bacterium]MCP4860742.1 amidinotransferase [Planctomycetota bacterium]